ncbi:MAG: serine/threonine-protein kinase [Pseudomonadota bacterium]
MKKQLAIPLGRQIQLAVCVFVLLPATLSFGPASQWFERLDLGLRQLTTPNAQVADHQQPLLVAMDPALTTNERLTALVSKLNRAKSVTLIDPIVGSDTSLVEAVRYHGAVYVTDRTDSDGNMSDAEIRAAARDTGHAMLPGNSRDRHQGLQAWKLSGNVMRSSAALQPLLPSENWRRTNERIYLYPQARLIQKRVAALEPITATALLARNDAQVDALVRDKHVFVGELGTTNAMRGDFVDARLIRFGKTHAALASGEVLLQPEWAMTLSWLIIAVGMFTLVSAMWRESRHVIAIGAITLAVFMLVAQWFLANQFALQIDILRPLVALASGCIICFWLTPDRQSKRRESFRSGLKYLRAGRLDAAFRVLRACPPHPSLMPTLYKLAIAFEKRNQPEQARAVFAYMGRRDKLPGTPPAAPSNPRREALADEVPERLGRYEILRALGKGAMGGVFLGRDPRINRLIALKLVSFRQYDDESVMVEMRSRFFREAESVGRLTHPCITAVYDSGEENGLGYIAMEYAPGTQLTLHTTADKLLDPVTVLQIGIKVAEALDYAHGEHVVHRDIKPANLLFDAQSDTIKVTDFGVAKLVDAERTQTGIILGTPSYMSPEQARGDAVTGSSDLFSLGVTLYELLTGNVPFHGKSIAELMTAITEKTPAPVSSVRPGLPEALDIFMQKALAKQPENRFADGNDMAFALRECVSAMFGRVVNE